MGRGITWLLLEVRKVVVDSCHQDSEHAHVNILVPQIHETMICSDGVSKCTHLGTHLRKTTT